MTMISAMGISVKGRILRLVAAAAIAVGLAAPANAQYRNEIAHSITPCQGNGPAVWIYVTNIDGSNGTMRIQLYPGTRADWLERGRWLNRIEMPARSGTMQVCMPVPRPGNFAKTTYAPAPQRFEAGTPAIVEAVGFAAACDYVGEIGIEAIHAHEADLVRQTREALRGMNDVTLYGPEDSAGIVSFMLDGVHPHDLGTILDEEGVAIRAGHHCAQPLMDRLGVPATARASFGIYSDEEDVAALIRGVERTKRIFG